MGQVKSALANKTDTIRVDRLKRRDNGARLIDSIYHDRWRMGEVVQLRDFQSQKDKERIHKVLREYADTSPSEMIPYHGAGIDGMWTDTDPA